MTPNTFYTLIKQQFPFQPTLKQDIVLDQISKFIFSNTPNTLYLLKGYAGTGKTSIIATVVTNLWRAKYSAVLMAPTGRAAKVISNYAKKEAFTIHKKIYYPKKNTNGAINFVLQPNKHKKTLFIVDEASMIPDTLGESKQFESRALLDDLIQYVYSGHDCKLLLIGDTAQLPPVKLQLSPALDENTLSLNYNKSVNVVELDTVMRQAKDSGILYNATLLREALQTSFYESFKFNTNPFKDIIRLIDGHDIIDAITDAYSSLGNEETTIIVRSNKRANAYNEQIRARILFHENELNAGDYLMVVKNNYFWVKPNTEAGFIANGDTIEVLEIFSIKELYGFRFAEIKVRMVDYPNMKPFETIVMLDTIEVNAASLSYEDSNRLYQEVMKDYEDETSKYKKFLKVKNNVFFNALQIKFSYAITCHKSQGGQWNTVFVEQPYLPNGIDKDYLRWLYTAATRAKERLYLIGFKNDAFEED